MVVFDYCVTYGNNCFSESEAVIGLEEGAFYFVLMRNISHGKFGSISRERATCNLVASNSLLELIPIVGDVFTDLFKDSVFHCRGIFNVRAPVALMTSGYSRSRMTRRWLHIPETRKRGEVTVPLGHATTYLNECRFLFPFTHS